MGFEFIKLIVNPTLFKTDDGLTSSNMWYFDRLVNLIVDENLVTVHRKNHKKIKMLK